MKNYFLFLFCLFASSFSSGYVPGTDDDPVIAAAKKVMDYPHNDLHGLFAGSFLKIVSEDKITEVLKKYNAEYGAFLNVRKTGEGKLEYRYKKALIPGTLHLDVHGKIESMWFGAAKSLHDTFDSVLADVKALGGTVAVTIRKNGMETLMAYNDTVPLGVGSAFKMAILKTLMEKIHRGEATWSDVIPLDKNRMSLPTGFLQTWQPGTPMTLASLANLMISQSDNTAADHLLFYCGRENVEKNVPARDRPYLSTLELFKLKWGTSAHDSILRSRYIAAQRYNEKCAILADVDSAASDSNLLAAIIASGPKDLTSLEWFYTTDEMCGMIEQVRGEPAMQINSSGIINTDDWKAVAYKGGSEPGVINMTYALESKHTNNYYTLAVTANNEKADYAVDDFASVVGRFADLIRKLDLGEQ